MTGRELKALVEQIPDDDEVQASDGYGNPSPTITVSKPKEVFADYDFWLLAGEVD